ncbi:MAG TPA: FAD-binding protein [Ktedonobacteraceae bacterium]|nr:FAD-binding protein [Ktedonobacteraceae bacterium]
MEKVQVQNWFGDITSFPQVIVEPESVQEISDIMRDAQRYPGSVRAIGSNHSTTACGATDGGTLVNMRKMNRIKEIRSDTVTVEAGALYIDVARELRKRNMQFYINVVIGNLTMGSAACCGTKDASMPGESGQVCSYVTELKLVKSSGELMTITAERDPELLQAVRSSYGLLGIVYEVTFKIRPLQSLAVYHKAYHLDQFAQQLPELKIANVSLMFYIYPFLDRITAECRKYNPDANPQRATHWQWTVRNYLWRKLSPSYAFLVSRYIPLAPLRSFLLAAFNRTVIAISALALRGRNTLPMDQQIHFSEQQHLSKFTFSFWAFPEENYIETLRAYFQFCQQYHRQTGYRPDMPTVAYRVNADDSSLFSYSSHGTVITIDPVSTGNKGWEEFLVAYNQFCSQHGGIPLFNQTKSLSDEQVRQAFADRIQKFEHYRSDFDPAGRLLNRYFRTFFGQKQKVEV